MSLNAFLATELLIFSQFRVPPSLLVALLLCTTSYAQAEAIPARNTQGAMHGFLLLKSSDGKVIATGDVIQIVHGREVHSRLVFHFRDGSVDDDTTSFRQGRTLRLISDHHIQKGPSFPKPLDIMISTTRSEASWKEFKDGKVEVKTEHVDLPDDVANGMVPMVLANVPPGWEKRRCRMLSVPPSRGL